MFRTLLFLGTNLAIVLVLGVFLNILLPILGIQAGNTTGLLVIAFVFGMGGSFISLLMSKWMAKRATGAQVIERPSNDAERWLMVTVERLAKQANIGMPEVAIFPSPDVNAFATGSNRDSSLVAVSAGLLRSMNRDEAEAVLAHEISHIANGDMVTMALVQGVLNTFVIFFARIIAQALVRGGNNQGSYLAYFGVTMVLEMVFGVLASIIAMWFSRQREFRADAGSAKLVGAPKMIAALQRLKSSHDSELDGQLVAFGIKGKARELFASHPSLDDRIAALQRS
ncbi:zinc metalloprotease HtpX [Saccharospirillum sp. MSK14-1]|uniref:protease HtpX n=1 Tax=Saccharospirillum sp. MSK14-1 TaxID=1897632 RepID=UPI000D35B6C9|nr:protease HtpX [Saccharospirillum sp. MSK14-1]PTY35716.1 zinc metalloprotease HtpX [Saccharospirillum sp. MSK14-1]